MLTLPAKDRGVAGARFNSRAIREAIEFLELACPVEIKWSNGTRRAGAHRFRNGHHLITVSTHVRPTSLSRVLWHELTHARQEETIEHFDAAYRSENKRRGYQRNRYEVEARQYAEAFADELDLAA